MPVRRKATGTARPLRWHLLPVAVNEPAGYRAWCPGPKGRPRGSGESAERLMICTAANRRESWTP